MSSIAIALDELELGYHATATDLVQARIPKGTLGIARLLWGTYIHLRRLKNAVDTVHKALEYLPGIEANPEIVERMRGVIGRGLELEVGFDFLSSSLRSRGYYDRTFTGAAARAVEALWSETLDTLSAVDMSLDGALKERVEKAREEIRSGQHFSLQDVEW